MSGAPSGWQTPKTNWQAADPVTAADVNRIEGNINAIELGNRTIDPAQAPTGNVGTLRQLLNWFPNRIKALAGTTNWYDTPPITLSGANDKFNATTGHTHSGAEGAAPPIPIGGINSAAKTTAGGTEANRLAVTNTSGRVGDAEKVGGTAPPFATASNLVFAGWQVFTSSGTFTVPSGVTRLFVEVVGGGGNGGAATFDYGDTGAGAGGGGYAAELLTGLTPGSNVSVSVGAAGGTSSFGAYLSASGGSNGAPSGDGGGGAGGVGSGGHINVRGGAGTAGNAITSSTDDTDILESGTGGASVYGGGGAGRHKGDGGGTGRSGGQYGGGGGGALTLGSTDYNGGSGAPGVVTVRW